MTPLYKECNHCKMQKPLTDFLRRTGRRAGATGRRGTCRDCRMLRKADGIAEAPEAQAPPEPEPAARTKPGRTAAPDTPPLQHRNRHRLPVQLPKADGPDASLLNPTGKGVIRMRGKTDRGRRWLQETDFETAVTLVRECAAVVVNRHTIRRLYSSRMFRQYILTRDRYTCHFCGEYGDTIDHLLPRAKGGHTTPVNCVCACNLCNQTKADRHVDEFMASR